MWKVKIVISTANSRPTRQANIKLPCLNHGRLFIEAYKLSSRFFCLICKSMWSWKVKTAKIPQPPETKWKPNRFFPLKVEKIGQGPDAYKSRNLSSCTLQIWLLLHQTKTNHYIWQTKLNKCKIWGAHNLEDKSGHSFVHLRFLSLLRPLV